MNTDFAPFPHRYVELLMDGGITFHLPNGEEVTFAYDRISLFTAYDQHIRVTKDEEMVSVPMPDGYPLFTQCWRSDPECQYQWSEYDVATQRRTHYAAAPPLAMLCPTRSHDDNTMRAMEEIFTSLLGGTIRQYLQVPRALDNVLTSVVATLNDAVPAGAPNSHVQGAETQPMAGGGIVPATGPAPANTDVAAPAPVNDNGAGHVPAVTTAPAPADADAQAAPPPPPHFLAQNDPLVLAVQAQRDAEDEKATQRAIMDALKRAQRGDDYRSARKLQRVTSSKKRRNFERKFGQGSWDPSKDGRKSKKPRRDDMEVDGEAAGNAAAQ